MLPSTWLGASGKLWRLIDFRSVLPALCAGFSLPDDAMERVAVDVPLLLRRNLALALCSRVFIVLIVVSTQLLLRT